MVGIANVINPIGLLVLIFAYIILSVSTNEIKTQERESNESEDDSNENMSSTVEETPYVEDSKSHANESLQFEQSGAQTNPSTFPILCLVFINNSNPQGKVVKETWGRKCKLLLFISNKTDPTLPSYGLSGSDWDIRKNALIDVYNKYRFYTSPYPNHWILLADDNTYFIMENLIDLLSKYDSNKDQLFGFNMVGAGGIKYVLESAGTVLSRRALINFVNIVRDKTKCINEHNPSDYILAKCLLSIKVFPHYSVDYHGKPLFLPYPLKTAIKGDIPSWLIKSARFVPEAGKDCCTRTPISYGRMEPEDMYEMEHLLYGISIANLSSINVKPTT